MVRGLVAILDDHHNAGTVEFLTSARNRMNRDFADACLGEVRIIIRMAPTVAQRDKIARSAWRPIPDFSQYGRP